MSNISKLVSSPLKSAEQQPLVEAAYMMRGYVVFEAAFASVAIARYLNSVDHRGRHAAGHYPHRRTVYEIEESLCDREVRY